MIFNKLRWQASSGCERLPWQRAPWERSKRKNQRSRHPDDIPSVNVSVQKGTEAQETSSRSPEEIEPFIQKPNIVGKDLELSLREAHVQELQSQKKELEKELTLLKEKLNEQSERTEEMKHLQIELQERKAEIEQLSKLIEQLKEENAKQEEQNKTEMEVVLKEQREKRERSLSEHIRRRDLEWETKLATLNQETDVVREKLQRVEEELEYARSRSEKLAEDKNKEEQITMDLEYQKSVVQSNLQSVKEELHRKESSCSELGLDLERARENLKEKDEVIRGLKDSLSQREEEIKIKDEQLKSATMAYEFEKVAFFTPRSEFQELQSKLREKDHQIRQLSDRITKQEELLSAFEELDLLRTQKEKKSDMAKTSPCSEDEKQEQGFLSVREEPINRSWNISPVRSSLDDDAKERLEAKIASLEDEVKEYRRKLEYYQSRDSREGTELTQKEKELEQKDGRIQKLKGLLEEERRKSDTSQTKRNTQQIMILQQEKQIQRLTEEREKLRRTNEELRREVKREKEEKDSFYIERIEDLESYIDELEAHLKKYKKLERERHEHMFDVDVQRPNSSMTEGISPSRLYFNQTQPLHKKGSIESFKTFTTTTKLTATRPSLSREAR